MAEEIYKIPDNPQYSENIRKLQDQDEASASRVFNPLFSRLIENIASLKRTADKAVPITRTVNGQALSSDITLTPFVAQAAPPSEKNLLWIDTTANTGGLKYFNGTAWVPVPVIYT